MKKEKISKFPFEIEIILRIVSLIHIFVSPFTKVEESFNLQATHDLLFYTNQLDRYDHLEFPGVVPRTFIGPIVLGFLSAPIVFISKYFFSKFVAQIIVRICLSELVIRSFQKFRQSISNEYGESFGIWIVLITSSQFHLMFYMSRTLPNIMAMPGALLAFHYWMNKNHGKFILAAAFDVIIFRAELAMLFGILLLVELYSRRLSLWNTIMYAVPSGLFCIFLSIAVDSIFWQRWVWPEGEVFWFNTIMNQSHKWGTEPFLWYFYSALPRALATSTFLIPYGLWINPKIRVLVIPCFVFILFFSILPHKELRFIFYTIPILNIGAGATCDIIWKNRGKGFLHALLSVGIIFHLVLNGVISTGLLIVSRQNYPGGNALYALHQVEDIDSSINLHIDVYSAQTGVSRFLEISTDWRYNKTENLKPGSIEMLEFTHLMLGTLDVDNRLKYIKTHDVALSMDGYEGIDLNLSRYPPIRVKTEQKVIILKRK